MNTLIKMQFDPKIAKELDTDSAIIYANIQFWCDKNRVNDKHKHDGKYWTYNSIKAFAEQFNYLSEKQIRRCLAKLEDAGYISTGNYNKTPFDQTKWYTDNMILPKEDIDLTKWENGDNQTGRPIPDNKPNNKPDIHYINWDKFLNGFNELTGKRFRGLNDKTKRQTKKLLNLGYSPNDIRVAILNCMNDEYHKQNPKYLTPEFITRPDKFEKYFAVSQKKLKLPDNWFNMELTKEQQELLTKEEKQRWSNHILRMKMEGGKPLKTVIEYE